MFVIGALWFGAFVVSFRRDRRRLRNGVYLVMALLFSALGILLALGPVSPVGIAVTLLMVTLVPLVTLTLAVFLIANGVTMIRREGHSPANLLSLLAGLGIFGFVVLIVLTNATHSEPLLGFTLVVTGSLAYLSFVFTCYLLYSILYGRIRHRGDVDFVVVLGSRLFGSKVPPLLASRLDRGRAAFDAATATGRTPEMITSGGRGPDEDVAEARAMADYLIARGVPENRIIVEDRSRTTLENLTLSKAIMEQRNPGYRCVVVTNNFHAFRAALTAREAGVNGQVIGSRTAFYFWPSATLREFAAILMEHWVLNVGICLALSAAFLTTLSV